VSVLATWNPDLPASLLLLTTLIALFLPELYELVWHKRFFSPEHKRLQDVTAWWQERAR
jgi:hypothetical protein